MFFECVNGKQIYGKIMLVVGQGEHKYSILGIKKETTESAEILNSENIPLILLCQ